MVFFEQQLSHAIKPKVVTILTTQKKTHESSSKNAHFLKPFKETHDSWCFLIDILLRRPA